MEGVNIKCIFFQKMMAVDWRIYLLSVIELIKLCNTDTSNQDRIEFSLNARPFTRNNNVQFIVLPNELFLKLNLIKSRKKNKYLMPLNNAMIYKKYLIHKRYSGSLFNIINSAIASNTGRNIL